MASITAFQSFPSIYIVPNHQIRFQQRSARFQIQRNALATRNLRHLRASQKSSGRKIRSAEEEAQITEDAAVEDTSASAAAEAEASVEQTVAVPVSPSDKLVMFFQAEGTMNETAITEVTKALEGSEGISDLKVHVSEGIATVELTKQTTIQATGVASGLVEIIQGSGFKLQTLNLSFEDEELVAV